jgi:hypothetical protein
LTPRDEAKPVAPNTRPDELDIELDGGHGDTVERSWWLDVGE